MLVLIFAFAAYKIFSEQVSIPGKTNLYDSIPTSSAKQKKVSQRYSCQGKIYCSEMTSCAEAKFYQRNCPGTKMDGDGIPCESQWCGY
ncbi:MAG: calcium-binding protein [Candidatus Electrothrix sp. EH2]|nr:calcium-binding protein [Candidatus Electrothrix sp. EH2]